MDSHSSNIHHSNPQHATPKRMGAVTGHRERSEVEAMIQRYLELAHSALKTEEGPPQPSPQNEVSK